jgi:regulator of protease activity HflC (stomatin/prohibitin superfamily)
MNVTTTLLCVVAFVVVVLVIFLMNAIRIVNEYQRLVVFRLGRCIGIKGPGLVLLIPVIDRAVKADLREQVREVPHQVSITNLNRLPVVFQSDGPNPKCSRCW